MRYISILVLLFLLASFPSAISGVVSPAGSLPPLTTLSPGGSVRIAQDLNVNVVMIGFTDGSGPQQINTTRFRSLLPPLSGAQLNGNAIVGYDVFGLEPYGLTFGLNYNVMHTPAAFNDQFFGFLSAIAIKQIGSPFGPGVPQLPVIPSQFVYDFCNVRLDPTFGCNFGPAPRANTRFITQNYFIDARVVEEALGDALPTLGVDTSKHTVVLINWWGRPDFIDHVYFKANELDVDTGANLGTYFSSMTSGWGGTAFNDPEDCPSGCPMRRLMYLDVSASPVERLGNWDITSPEARALPADGIPDDRLPPIWEYGNNNGYRPFNDLTGDLAAKFVGDVFVQLVATANPGYPTALSPPRQPQHLQLDINLFDAVAGVNTSTIINPAEVVARLSVLPYTFTTEFTRTTALPSRLSDVLDCYRTFGLISFGGDSCYGRRTFGTSGADLYSYFRDHAFEYLEGDAQYEVPIFMFHLPDAQSIPFASGLADENWADRVRQSFVYSFSSPQSFGPAFLPVGKTQVIAHEVGHHLGLTHPHDGFICADPLCVDAKLMFANGSSYYGFLGDQQSSLMSYIHANDDFGQFDLDKMDRYLTYTYLSLSNVVLDKIASSSRSSGSNAAISAADADATAALAAYQAMQYRSAVLSARSAYDRLLAVVDGLHIPFDSANWHGDFRTPADVRNTWRTFLRTINTDQPESQVDFMSSQGIGLTTRAWSK